MSEMRTELGRATARTAEERQKAAVRVAGHAESEQDCRLLLQMLGLLPERKPARSECGREQWHLRVTVLTPLGACGRCHNRLRTAAL